MPTVDFVKVLTNLQKIVILDGLLWNFVTALCWLMAGVFGVTAIIQLKGYAEDGRSGLKAPIMSFIAAVLMSSSPTFLKTILVTSYGADAFGHSPLSLVKDDSSNHAFSAVLSLVSFVGYCFFVRGIWVLKEAGENSQRHQQSSIGKAVCILLSGMAAIYIDQTLKIFAGTFGWDVSLYLN